MSKRNVKNYTVPTPAEGERPNRDAGKVFRITEVSAMRLERWCMRALGAVARAGVDVGDLQTAYTSGIQAVMMIGIEGLLKMDDQSSESLRDEMLECVEIVPDPANAQISRPLIESDIDELSTLLTLRSEIITIHTGFSVAGAISPRSTSASPSEPRPNSSTTSTSRPS